MSDCWWSKLLGTFISKMLNKSIEAERINWEIRISFEKEFQKRNWYCSSIKLSKSNVEGNSAEVLSRRDSETTIWLCLFNINQTFQDGQSTSRESRIRWERITERTANNHSKLQDSSDVDYNQRPNSNRLSYLCIISSPSPTSLLLSL